MNGKKMIQRKVMNTFCFFLAVISFLLFLKYVLMTILQK